MKIDEDIAEYIQERLSFLTLDCDYATSFFGCLPKEISDKARWQLAVDMIYRFLLSGLIVPGHERKRARESGLAGNPVRLKEEYRQYVELLSKANPYASGSDDIAWYIWDLCSSELGNELLKKYKIDTYEDVLCEQLIGEIEILFEAAGVPWKEEPIIPIDEVI